MKQPKFILTGTGFLRMGKVALHKDLLEGDETCMGGGYYEFDFLGGRLLLRGRSYDFGKPRWDRFDGLKVPSACRGFRIIYVSGEDGENDFAVSEALHIEYVPAGPGGGRG